MDALTVQLIDLGPAGRVRASRHQAINSMAQRHGFGSVHWRCPWCGGSDHGIPSAMDASVSSSSHDGLLVVAFDALKRRLGIDLTAAQAPAEAAGIATALFSPGERKLATAGGWLHSRAFSRVWAGKEALGKAHGCGLAVDHAGEDGGILDTVRHKLWLREWTDLPEGLITVVALEIATR